MANYFNTLPLREQLAQLGVCRFMEREEFDAGCEVLKGKKIVIVGCGAQGLNQGLNMRDSGLDVSYALRQAAIDEKRDSFLRASENGFVVGTYQDLIPSADLVYNLTPDKQHSAVVDAVMPLMQKGSTLGYSHGFNIVEEGKQIREDITVVMCAPKCPGTEVREEYKRGFGVPTLIAVHAANDPEDKGWDIAKALASATGGDRAGVLESSFVAEVKSDLMGEQTILCGMQQAAAVVAYEKMVAEGIDAGYAANLIQYGLEVITEAMKVGGVSHMLDRLSNQAKVKAFGLSEELKELMRPLFEKHQDDIISGEFSKTMMADWDNNDANLLRWREETGQTAFEQSPQVPNTITEQEFFDKGIFLVACIRAGVELAFEVMVESGILPESAYYESLHETPLISNTIARKRLYEMNVVISDTAEYGNYLFANAAIPLLREKVMPSITTEYIGKGITVEDNAVDNKLLVEINDALRNHPVEWTGQELRGYMTDMKKIQTV
ncbi:ketol-acid reductoisomerase (NADP(+)) [Psychrosphaera saromensis]|uniref:Ketol-acid reductoisomerase (NADP(+)) n=1 Tax=Psychrosphaera saromensis TaxID=716813 RepID=A0A2S7UTV6_9GAMM|nr:ketol-acid reductoisomerase [Psychrosphaera saromensis]PQJ52710.1 ketol-acid reductoisomerase [Psychrosphaera saromensis]GHB70617.1 ketol-acid reductoisomerase (NADP(+)) [Psychrosphaera saromensis]GLQ13195.1 ketol-acid reductoisomerase (NADP(+)) [Psychrosphaera saromensis]